MGLNEQFIYDTFNLYYNKGMSAIKEGNVDLAKRNILLERGSTGNIFLDFGKLEPIVPIMALD
jgi:hypothetical protein